MMTLMMADQGAEVIKVEPPAGDPARDAGAVRGGTVGVVPQPQPRQEERRARSQERAGRAALWDADRPRRRVRRRLPARRRSRGSASTTTRCAARNPRIVYCSISAFGQTGALAHHPAHDMAVQALAGSCRSTTARMATPVVPGVPSADMAAGLTALSAVLMALIARGTSGRGEYVDVRDVSTRCCRGRRISPAARLPVATARVRRRSARWAGRRFYNVYATADGRHIALGGREPKFVAQSADRARPRRPGPARRSARRRAGRADRLSARRSSRRAPATNGSNGLPTRTSRSRPCSTSARRSTSRMSPNAGCWWKRRARIRSRPRSGSRAKAGTAKPAPELGE